MKKKLIAALIAAIIAAVGVLSSGFIGEETVHEILRKIGIEEAQSIPL